MKRILITILIIAMLQMSVCTFAQGNGPQLKRNGDEVLVEGEANSVGETVTLKVYNEAGNLIYIYQTNAGNLKSYSFSFTPKITKTENLTIQVKCANSEEIEEITAPYEVAEEIAPPAADEDEEGYNTPPGGGEVSTGGNTTIGSVQDMIANGKNPSGTGSSSGGGGGGFASADKKEETNQETENSLKDITNHWGKADIAFLYEKGIVTGDTEGNYNPDAKIKRSEFLALTVRALGLENADYADEFNDVSRDAWYAPIVQSALNKGIISSDTMFRPDAEITRQEMAKMAASVLELTDENATVTEFSDSADISDWAKPYIEKALRIGLIKGDEKGFFNPHSGTTKAEAAAVIKRLYDRVEVQ